MQLWKTLRILLTHGIVLAMILGMASAAFAQEIVEDVAPVEPSAEVPIDENGQRLPPVDQELPPPPEEPEEPLVMPSDGVIEEPMVIGPANTTEQQGLISPGGESNSGLSAWEWAGIVGATVGALLAGAGIGALVMHNYDRHHLITH